jgi:hypothetical protein
LRNNYSNSNKKTKTSKKHFKFIYKKKQFTKVIISALLVDNNIIKTLNNIDITSTSLNLREEINSNISTYKITKEGAKYSKKELEFIDIINNKIIKRTKALNYNKFNNKVLILDSGASKHYMPYKDILLHYKMVNNKSVIIANKVKLPIKGIGHIPIIINKDTFLINNVNYILNIKITLISFKELTNKG